MMKNKNKITAITTTKLVAKNFIELENEND